MATPTMMLDELSQDDLLNVSRSLDPVLLAEDVGFELDDWQKQVLRSKSSKLLLLCSRQSGKSTVSALLAIWTALYIPESLILLFSPSERQSSEIFRKCLDAYRKLGRPIPADAENKLTLELTHGSRIISLPGTETTIRGFSGVKLIVADEASRIPDELYAAITPMLAVSKGRLVCLSTPNGERGFFWSAWTKERDWEKIRVTADQCPRISAEFLESERARHGERFYAQEYMTVFVSIQDAVFNPAEIDAAIANDVKPLFCE